MFFQIAVQDVCHGIILSHCPLLLVRLWCVFFPGSPVWLRVGTSRECLNDSQPWFHLGNWLWLGCRLYKGGIGLSGFCGLEKESWECWDYLMAKLHLGQELDGKHRVQDQCDWDGNCLPHLMRPHQDQEEVESAGIFWCPTTWSRPGCRTCARQSWWGLELPTRILSRHLAWAILP